MSYFCIMGQLLLPIFPRDTRMINSVVGVREHDISEGSIRYAIGLGRLKKNV